MSGPFFLFGKSPARLRAEQKLTETEDRLMEILPEERRNLAFHVDRQQLRNDVITMRTRDLQAVFTEKSDRNWWTLVLIFLILFAKGTLSVGDIVHWVGGAFGIH